MVRIKYILFFLFICANFSVFCPVPSLATNQNNESQLPIENLATINQLRFWSNIRYTRIVIDLDNEVLFNFNLTKIQPPTKASSRLSIDIQNCMLSEKVKRTVQINDELIADARLDQFTSSSVRVLIDIKILKEYKIFSLSNPFRIVIDFWGTASEEGSNLPTKGSIIKDALIKQLDLGVRRICIDPGFGGREKGAPGCKKGVFSKDINLELAKMLANKIREKLNLEVIMTRKADKHLTLEERTAIANTKNADLFISIHTNAAEDQTAYGIETYFLSPAGDKESILAPARPNAASTNNFNDLDVIMSDLLQNSKFNESERLANQVQKSLYNHMKKQYSCIKNRGAKRAPFYVLIGAQMPAILVEIGFITNRKECERLLNQEYQDHLVEGFLKGIQKYISEMKGVEQINYRTKQ